MEYIIVTRHAGLTQWLAMRGITGSVRTHVADRADIAERHVVGVLPLFLAAAAASITTVDLPGLTPEQRGVDLTPDEMDAAGATLRRYRVIEQNERDVRHAEEDREEAEYESDLAELDRLAAECGAELPELGASATLSDFAQRLLDSEDPPRGADADLCRRIAGA